MVCTFLYKQFMVSYWGMAWCIILFTTLYGLWSWCRWCSDGDDKKPHGWHGLEATNNQSTKSMVESNSIQFQYVYVDICVFSTIYMNIPTGFLGLSNGWNTHTLWIASGNETCPSWDQNMRFEGSPLAVHLLAGALAILHIQCHIPSSIIRHIRSSGII